MTCIQEHYPQANLIATGGIGGDGHPKQDENALEALSPFRVRILIAPGNHDLSATADSSSKEPAWRLDEDLSLPLKEGGTFTGDRSPVVNIVREGDAAVMPNVPDTHLEAGHLIDFASGSVPP